MIIKSMSRKNKSFWQLLRYIEKEQVTSRFIWNLYSNINDRKNIVKEFIANAKHLKNARGKVYIYHEILSLEDSSLSLKRQEEILQDLTRKYISSRANNHLVYGCIHNDKNNLHMHLMISSNAILEQKRTRLSKQKFKQIQQNLEIYKNHTYPELGKSNFYNQQHKDRSKTKKDEQEIKHRRKKQTKKEFLKENLQSIFARSLSKTALENSLKNNGFYLYQRATTFSIKYENKSYRLKTLGLDLEYKKALGRIEKIEARKERRSEFKRER
jgi:hypothetical protein